MAEVAPAELVDIAIAVIGVAMGAGLAHFVVTFIKLTNAGKDRDHDA